jgi:hypothetical protein
MHNIFRGGCVFQENDRQCDEIALVLFIDRAHRFAVAAVKPPDQHLVFNIHTAASKTIKLSIVINTTPGAPVLVYADSKPETQAGFPEHGGRCADMPSGNDSVQSRDSHPFFLFKFFFGCGWPMVSPSWGPPCQSGDWNVCWMVIGLFWF